MSWYPFPSKSPGHTHMASMHTSVPDEAEIFVNTSPSRRHNLFRQTHFVPLSLERYKSGSVSRSMSKNVPWKLQSSPDSTPIFVATLMNCPFPWFRYSRFGSSAGGPPLG